MMSFEQKDVLSKVDIWVEIVVVLVVHDDKPGCDKVEMVRLELKTQQRDECAKNNLDKIEIDKKGDNDFDKEREVVVVEDIDKMDFDKWVDKTDFDVDKHHYYLLNEDDNHDFNGDNLIDHLMILLPVVVELF